MAARAPATSSLLDRLEERARAIWRGDWLAAGRPLRRRRDRVFAPTLPSHGLYSALLLLLLGAAALSVRYRADPFLQEVGLNLATDAFSIIITVAIVQRFLERQDRARRLRGAVGGLRKARRALADLIAAWTHLIRASSRHSHRAAPTTVEELFAPELTEQLMYLGERTSADPLDATERLLHAQRGLSDVVRTYGATLDPVYLEAIDELADDPFPGFVASLQADEGDARETRVRLNVARGARITHFSRLLDVIHLQNEFAREAGRLRADDAVRATDTFGLRLEADHDLRLPLRLTALD